MAGFFSKLYDFVTKHRSDSPPSRGGEPTKLAKIRKAAAAEHQSRKQQSQINQQQGQINQSLADMKAKIAGESAKILADLRQDKAAQMELDRQAALERAAEQEKRIEDASPANQFLAGKYKLTLNRDFRSSNPSKPAVYQVWYVPAAQEIWVTFFEDGRPGRTYRYWVVTQREARDMYVASSKGIHVWDAFRVRGSKTAHKKNYAQV